MPVWETLEASMRTKIQTTLQELLEEAGAWRSGLALIEQKIEADPTS
jgi:hypothetical protein